VIDARSRAGCRRCSSESLERSTGSGVAADPSSPIASTPGLSARRAKSGPRSSTSCRTRGTTACRSRASIPSRRLRGSTGGRSGSSRRSGIQALRPGPGSSESAGVGTVPSEWRRARVARARQDRAEAPRPAEAAPGWPLGCVDFEDLPGDRVARDCGSITTNALEHGSRVEVCVAVCVGVCATRRERPPSARSSRPPAPDGYSGSRWPFRFSSREASSPTLRAHVASLDASSNGPCARGASLVASSTGPSGRIASLATSSKVPTPASDHEARARTVPLPGPRVEGDASSPEPCRISSTENFLGFLSRSSRVLIRQRSAGRCELPPPMADRAASPTLSHLRATSRGASRPIPHARAASWKETLHLQDRAGSHRRRTSLESFRDRLESRFGREAQPSERSPPPRTDYAQVPPRPTCASHDAPRSRPRLTSPPRPAPRSPGPYLRAASRAASSAVANAAWKLSPPIGPVRSRISPQA
jgi:hypothetical protein